MNRLFTPVVMFLSGLLAASILFGVHAWHGAQQSRRAAAQAVVIAGDDGSLLALALAGLLALGAMIAAFWLLAWRYSQEQRGRARSDDALHSLRTLLAAAPLAFVAWDRTRGVLLWSDSAERMFGLDRERALGQVFPASLMPLRDAVEASLQDSDVVVALQLGLRNEHDEHMHLSVSASRMAAEGDAEGTIAAVIEDLTPHRLREARRLEALRVQRDALVREVHHRIKNHLQGVAGLLRQHLAGKPLLKPLLEAATAQVLSIAAVHGLQGETRGGALELRGMVARIATSISGIMHVPIVLSETCASMDGLLLAEEEAVPMAMVLNEILMNAVKHRVRGGNDGLIHVGAVRGDATIAIRISNQGFLPPRFNFALGAQVGTGLGLVKSLLPSHGVALGIEEEGDTVVATLSVGAPHLLPAQRGDAGFGHEAVA